MIERMKLSTYRRLAIGSWLLVGIGLSLAHFSGSPSTITDIGQVIWCIGVVCQLLLGARYVRDRATSGTGLFG